MSTAFSAGNHALSELRTTAPVDLRDSWLTRTPIAHRGLHSLAEGRPENSLAAFERSCALGFPIELDARLTRDGEIVVFHDRTLRRLTGIRGRVEDRDAAAITVLPLLGSSERVPLLGEVLDLVAGRVPLLIELKSSGLTPLLERGVLRALRDYTGEVAIQSFKRRTLWRLERYDTGHAVGHLSRWYIAPVGVQPAFFGCQVDGVPSRAVQRRRAAGSIVLAWTVRSPEEAERVAPYVDNYIFEDYVPDVRSFGARRDHVSVPSAELGASR